LRQYRLMDIITAVSRLQSGDCSGVRPGID